MLYIVVVKGDPKAPFSFALVTQRLSFSRIALDPYLLMLSVKQGGIKYYFFSLWYDSTWDWKSVSWAISEHSTH